MSLNRDKIYNKAKIYAAMFIMTAALITDVVFIHILEQDKRQQARYNLEHTTNCFRAYEANMNVLDNDGLKHCTKKMRTSPTGDMYVVDLADLKFVHDGSTDIPQDEIMFFTKESIGVHFTEWHTAEDALIHLTSGNDSGVGTDAWYNYDGSKELLEFCSYTTNTGKYYVVVQGVQVDEMREIYLVARMLGAFFVMIYVLWLVSSAIHYNRREENDSTR